MPVNLPALGEGLNCRNPRRSRRGGGQIDGLKDARGLSDVGGTFEYLLRENASDGLIISHAYAYSIRVEHLKEAFDLLQAYTDDERFQLMFSAISSYHLFLQVVSFGDSTTRNTLIEKNLETTKELDSLLKDLTRYQNPGDLPPGLVEKIFQTSEKLEV